MPISNLKVLILALIFLFSAGGAYAFYHTSPAPASDPGTQSVPTYTTPAGQTTPQTQSAPTTNTTDTSLPGIPSTGAGGQAMVNISLLLGSALLAAVGLTYTLRRKQR